MTFRTLSVLSVALLVASTTNAALVFEEDFSVDPTAEWTVNDPGLSDILADFSYDYSGIGVPSAPSGVGTVGLKMTANNSGGVFSGFSVSPTGKSFSGDYRVEFDLWQNYVGPVGAGGSGTTQLSMFGIGTSGTTPVWAGSVKESLGFGITLDGGSSVDYRIYSTQNAGAAGLYPEGDPVYSSGGGRNGSDAYYAGFGGESAPGDQVTLYPGQTGSTDAGEIAFAWRSVVIDVTGGIATMSIDGLEIGEVDMSTVTAGGGNIFFGHGDTNSSSSSDPNDSLLNVTLIDNIRVTGIPEPSTAVLLFGATLAVAGLASRRK